MAKRSYRYFVGDFETTVYKGQVNTEVWASAAVELFTEDVKNVLSALSAAALLVFCLLYTPCVAAISAVKRELGKKYALFVVLFQCAIAWIAAWSVETFLSAI